MIETAQSKKGFKDWFKEDRVNKKKKKPTGAVDGGEEQNGASAKSKVQDGDEAQVGAIDEAARTKKKAITEAKAHGGDASSDKEDSPSRQLRREQREALQRKNTADPFIPAAILKEFRSEKGRFDASSPPLTLAHKLDAFIAATDQAAAFNAAARRLHPARPKPHMFHFQLKPAINKWLQKKLGEDW